VYTDLCPSSRSPTDWGRHRSSAEVVINILFQWDHGITVVFKILKMRFEYWGGYGHAVQDGWPEAVVEEDGDLNDTCTSLLPCTSPLRMKNHR